MSTTTYSQQELKPAQDEDSKIVESVAPVGAVDKGALERSREKVATTGAVGSKDVNTFSQPLPAYEFEFQPTLKKPLYFEGNNIPSLQQLMQSFLPLCFLC